MNDRVEHTFAAMPDAVAAAYAAIPETQRQRLAALRQLLLEVARHTEGVGPITETLKWGEPAYLTAATRSGTTIRLGISKAAPADCALFVSCNSNLVPQWRDRYADRFSFEGNRALILPLQRDWPEAELRHCIAMALTYHARKRQPAA